MVKVLVHLWIYSVASVERKVNNNLFQKRIHPHILSTIASVGFFNVNIGAPFQSGAGFGPVRFAD